VVPPKVVPCWGERKGLESGRLKDGPKTYKCKKGLKTGRQWKHCAYNADSGKPYMQFKLLA